MEGLAAAVRNATEMRPPTRGGGEDHERFRLELTDEVNAVILGQEFGTQMQAMFEKDLASSNSITLEQWDERPISMRLKELIAQVWQRGL